MFYLKAKKILKNRRVIVTAGGTIEPIDPVRYIGNFSSGKMGVAIAKEFRKYTKNVILIYANISVQVPKNIISIRALTVDEMLKNIQKHLDSNAILIMAAAVSDYKVDKVSQSKIKKNKSINLKLIPTTDILKEISKDKSKNNFFIGFAAETENVIKNAKKKLKEKRLDMIVANPINKKNYPFGSDYNKVYFITDKEVEELPMLSKERISELLLRRIIDEINKL